MSHVIDANRLRQVLLIVVILLIGVVLFNELSSFVPAVLGAPWMITVPRGQQVQTAIEIKSGLEAPLAKGAVVGKVVASFNGKPVGEAPLVAQVDVERAGFLMRGWQHVAKLFGK